VLAPLIRQVAGLAIALEHEEPEVDRLIEALRVAEQALTDRAPADKAPRVGPDATAEQRIYVDHSKDIGKYNPSFPDYSIEVAGDRAGGSVAFPLAFEGPPGIVHGGFLAVFFDCVIQHHNCEVGQTGKTVSLSVSYHRPTPLLTLLDFAIERSLTGRRIESSAHLSHQGVTLCTARMDVVAGDRSRLPEVAPRRARH
jgi:hypothetical protein